MKIIKPKVHIENENWEGLLRHIELKGRVCYKSEDRINKASTHAFILALIRCGHLSVLEHETVSVNFIVDRGISMKLSVTVSGPTARRVPDIATTVEVKLAS